MDTYIVRQPILDRKMMTAAYELVYQQDSSALYNQQDARVADAILSFFNEMGSDTALLEGRDTYVTFTPNLLLQNSPSVFDPKRVVLQIEENVLIHPATQEMLVRYKEQGFRLALLSFDFNRRYLDILPLVDIMKVDLCAPEDASVKAVVDLAKQEHKTTVAYNVNTPEALACARKLGVDYVQGQSVADMVTTKSYKMEHLRTNLFRLMVAITRDEPDFEEIAGLISLDVTLTYSLIKMVNSAYFALPNRVQTVRQALAILGVAQLRQWIYLVSFSSEDALSNELIKISLLRGLFCQELSKLSPGLPMKPSEAYLLGMFSTLGLLLQVPLDEAVAELAISDEVKNGLTGKAGAGNELLSLCIAFEKAEWTRMQRHADTLRIPVERINPLYLSAAEETGNTWSKLMRPFVEEE